jgi:hypothetical protein
MRQFGESGRQLMRQIYEPGGGAFAAVLIPFQSHWIPC